MHAMMIQYVIDSVPTSKYCMCDLRHIILGLRWRNTSMHEHIGVYSYIYKCAVQCMHDSVSMRKLGVGGSEWTSTSCTAHCRPDGPEETNCHVQLCKLCVTALSLSNSPSCMHATKQARAHLQFVHTAGPRFWLWVFEIRLSIFCFCFGPVTYIQPSHVR